MHTISDGTMSTKIIIPGVLLFINIVICVFICIKFLPEQPQEDNSKFEGSILFSDAQHPMHLQSKNQESSDVMPSRKEKALHASRQFKEANKHNPTISQSNSEGVQFLKPDDDDLVKTWRDLLFEHQRIKPKHNVEVWSMFF